MSFSQFFDLICNPGPLLLRSTENKSAGRDVAGLAPVVPFSHLFGGFLDNQVPGQPLVPRGGRRVVCLANRLPPPAPLSGEGCRTLASLAHGSDNVVASLYRLSPQIENPS